MAIQDGHRKRVKDRFRKEGLANFDERYVLELLLFYCIPRQDTKELACRLLEHFGSIVQVLEAPVEELEKVPGVGEGVSTFLSLHSAVEQYYQIKRAQQRGTIIKDAHDYIEFLRPYFLNKRNENVYLLCLDAKCKVIACKWIGEGGLTSANAPVRKIVETALGVNAASIVLAHNHPGGLTAPSNDDIQCSFRIEQAMRIVDIAFIDHVVFAGGSSLSMRTSGYLDGGNSYAYRVMP